MGLPLASRGELTWTIQLSNKSSRELEVGDLAVTFPFNTSYAGPEIGERRLIRHSFVGGDGSFYLLAACRRRCSLSGDDSGRRHAAGIFRSGVSPKYSNALMGRGLLRCSLKPNISSVPRLLAFVTGLVNQELLLKNEYLLVENRILKAHLQPGTRLSRPERTALAEIGKQLGATPVCNRILETARSSP
jgi:hypothetical protein